MSSPSSRVGSQFGRYRLLRLLGRGGMGEVYEAEDTRKRRVVALKLVSPQFSSDPVFRARMLREAEAAGRLTEPHVVPIHDYGEIDGNLYVEMRLIDGVDLATQLKRSGPLNPPRAVAVVRQIAAALDAAHSSGVTHRDVKPENILITGDDFAYLVDFGIARAATDPGLTQTGMAMGTYNYMAPERFTGDEVTYRADVYSLACVLAESLTGVPPFRADSIERLIAAHLMEPAPQPSKLRPRTVPAALDQVIAKGMAKSPEERYRSAGELADAALQALDVSGQHQAVRILRHGEETLSPAGAAETQIAPVSTDAGQWSSTEARAWARTPHPPSESRWASVPGDDDAARRSQPRTSYASPAGPPDFSAPPQPRDKRRPILLGAGALIVVAVVAIAGYLIVREPQSSSSASGQAVLPFQGIDFRLSPGGVALDRDGAVYVSSEGMYGRVVKLAPGSSTPTVLPFNGLYQPQGLAVDSAGAVYVSDFNNRVVRLAAGSNAQTVLPFTGLDYPEGVAVDGADNVYVADRGNSRVVRLTPGSNAQTVLPFTGLKNPDGVAVDGAGNVYVADSDNDRVVKLAAGSNAQTVLPFTGMTMPWGIAVDSGGDVYVTDHDTSKVLKLAAGADTSTVLPFTGLNTPLAVTADRDGNVYVADRGNDRVVKLAAGAQPG